MNSTQFLVIIACMLCLALGAIALNQVIEEPQAPSSVQVMESDSTAAEAATPVRL